MGGYQTSSHETDKRSTSTSYQVTITMRVLLSAIASAGLASAATVHEPALSERWATHLELRLPRLHTVHVGLAMTNIDLVEKTVSQVSDPSSPHYGKYLSRDEVNRMTAPLAAHTRAVENWLSSHEEKNAWACDGMTTTKVANGATYDITAPIECIETLFNTRMRHVTNKKTGQTVKRAGDYTIPDEAADAVTFVSGLHGLPLPPKPERKVGAPRDLIAVVPSVIHDVYNISGVTPSGDVKNRQAVAEFAGQTFNPKDLVNYFEKYVPAKQRGDDQLYKVVGTNNPNVQSGVEAALDVEVIMGVAPGIKTEFWGYQGQDFCNDLIEFTNKILSDAQPPNVFSISYGYQGPLSDLGCTQAELTLIDDNFKKVAMRGITVLFASGDSGSAEVNAGFGEDKIYASWPASSPYVTSVGATYFINSSNEKSGEKATTQFGSGGGFSDRFSQTNAKWQSADVASYLSTVSDKPASKYFSPTGRATPDLAALGEMFTIYIPGPVDGIAGTSASTPTVAAMISLLNEKRVQEGKPTLGLLNEWLYASENRDMFYDVTVGNNRVGRQGQKFDLGWDCQKGWDAVTGLGTPNFGKMMENLPSN